MFKQNFIKIGLGGGLILGLLLNSALFGIAFLGKNPLGSLQFAYVFAFFVLTMGAALKYFRDYQNAGSLRTWQGIAFASTIGFIGIFLYLLGIYFLFSSNTDAFFLYIDQVKISIERMTELAGEEVTKSALEELKTLNVTNVVWNEAKKLIIINLVFSLFTGVIFRKSSS